jgi:hypothetical protein
VQKAHNCLTRATRHAKAQDLVRRNISTLVDTPRGQEGRPSQSLTLEQASALLAEAEKSRLHVYICFVTADWRAVRRGSRFDADIEPVVKEPPDRRVLRAQVAG